MAELSKEVLDKIIEFAAFHLENILEDLKKQQIGGRYSLKKFAEEVVENAELGLGKSDKQLATKKVVDFVLEESKVNLNKCERNYFWGGRAVLVYRTIWSPNVYLRAIGRVINADQAEVYYELSNWIVPEEDDPGPDVYVNLVGEAVMKSLFKELKVAVDFLQNPEMANTYQVNTLINDAIDKLNLKDILHKVILSFLGLNGNYAVERQYPFKRECYDEDWAIRVCVRSTNLPDAFFRNYVSDFVFLDELPLERCLDNIIISYLSNEYVPEDGDPGTK